MAKFFICIADDWELLGSGSGNVAELQYIPAMKLIQLVKEFNIPITFMVEVFQQIKMKEYAKKDKNIEIQCKLWEDCIGYFLDCGHDVQLHIHSQWIDAFFDDKQNKFIVGRNWNLATYPREKIFNIVKLGKEFLLDITNKYRKNYSIIAYKAGAWSLQPSKNILESLIANGIKIDFSVVKGKKIINKNFKLDYTNIKSDIFPYFPSINDVTQKSTSNRSLIIAPVATYKYNFFSYIKFFISSFKSRFCKERYRFTENPLVEKSCKLKKVLRKIKKNEEELDLSMGPFTKLKYAFDYIIQRRLQYDNTKIYPILLQSHTKNMFYYEDIKRFFEYILNTYGDNIEFVSANDFYNKIIELKLYEE